MVFRSIKKSDENTDVSTEKFEEVSGPDDNSDQVDDSISVVMMERLIVD